MHSCGVCRMDWMQEYQVRFHLQECCSYEVVLRRGRINIQLVTIKVAAMFAC